MCAINLFLLSTEVMNPSSVDPVFSPFIYEGMRICQLLKSSVH
jgi:hypothetical protein